MGPRGEREGDVGFGGFGRGGFAVDADGFFFPEAGEGEGGFGIGGMVKV